MGGGLNEKSSFLFQKPGPHIFKEAIRSSTDELQTKAMVVALPDQARGLLPTANTN